MDRARKAYYAQLTFIDHQINRIVQALNERGVLEDTWILFVSDHGDMLYDHNRVAKAVPYEASARVPLVVRFPDSFAVKSPDAKAGRMVDAPVEMRDIFPTLCDIAGIPIPAGVEGKSLLPFIVGDVAEWREYIHGEHEWGLESNQWLTDGKIKYIWFSQSGVEQLFDLSADPNEQRNLAAARPDVIAEWRRRLIAELDGREEGYVEHGRLVAGRKPTAVLTRA
jgi:arylsulfatase A-like enzyme